MEADMKELNEVIHQPVRLRIMSVLSQFPTGDQVEFVYLKKILNLTDGNLGAHLNKLEQAGYIMTEKTFVKRKPCTYISLARQGRNAYEEYLEALAAVLKSDAGQTKQAAPPDKPL
jgi:DNA-binding MarR family transcriptional regulator